MTTPLFILTDMFRFETPPTAKQIRYSVEHETRIPSISLIVEIRANGRMFTDMHIDGDWLEIEHTDILNLDRHECEHLGKLIVYALTIEGPNFFKCSSCDKLIG